MHSFLRIISSRLFLAGLCAPLAGSLLLAQVSVRTVKVLAGQAFRTPSIYELYYAGGGQLTNPNLSPEHMASAEIEYSHRFTQTITGLLSVYDNVITNLIAQRSAGATLPDLPVLSEWKPTVRG